MICIRSWYQNDIRWLQTAYRRLAWITLMSLALASIRNDVMESVPLSQRLSGFPSGHSRHLLGWDLCSSCGSFKFCCGRFRCFAREVGGADIGIGLSGFREDSTSDTSQTPRRHPLPRIEWRCQRPILLLFKPNSYELIWQTLSCDWAHF